ncbi:G-protein coupled receptor 157-like isoform X1 [Ruditapes philippinarum]|uniref:G-protein coupled receptor 157-like isoform X1 n=1 Tax=Ruditapes philippinarum TaxID=129788 RepID=UPI00295BD1AB|nr:G-protein coupled receptor 157-like isoform X1 [Ruditapes philippinarum]
MEMSYVSTTSTYNNVTAATLRPSNHSVPIYVLVVTILSCLLSLIGIICIFVSYYAIASVRNYIRKLLLCLTIANLLDVIGIIIGLARYILLEYTDVSNQHEQESCTLHSFITSFAPCSSFFWTVLIAVYIQVQVLKPRWVDNMSNKRATVTYHVMSWGIPGITCIVGLYFDVFGDTEDIFTGPWCWIRTSLPRKTAILWMFLTVKGWEILSYIILAEVLVYVVYKKYILPTCMKKRRTPFAELFGQNTQVNVSEGLRPEDKNFVYVWLIFYVLRFGGTFRFLMHIIKEPTDGVMINTDRAMMVWQAFGDTAQAFGNFIFLCVFDKSIRQHYCSKHINNISDDHVAARSEALVNSGFTSTESLPA